MKVFHAAIIIVSLVMSSACRMSAGIGERVDYDDLDSGSSYGRNYDRCGVMIGETQYDDLDAGSAYGRRYDVCGSMVGGAQYDDLDAGSAYGRRYEQCVGLKEGAVCQRVKDGPVCCRN